MSQRYSAYFPLVLALLFGLAISFIPTSPALGDSIGACQGNGNSTTHITLGGRTITPTLLLQANGGQPCPAGETSLSLVTLSHTVIVSPNGTPVQNGAAVLAARNIISNANPSAANPWLLKLEPGNYDLNGGSLALLPYVDLEGSGEDVTVISSTVGTANNPIIGTINAASNSEVRFLQVLNSGSASLQAAVSVPLGVTNAHFTHITTNATGPNSNYGFYNISGGTVIVQNATLSASGPAGSASAGLDTESGTLIASNSAFSASGGTGSFGIVANGTGVVSVTNSTLSASGATSNYGFSNSNGTSTVINSTLSASGGTNNYGFFNFSGTGIVSSSILTATGGTISYGFAKINGTAQVATSQLSGSSASSIGLTVCLYSYHANFTPLNGSCA